MSNNVPSTDFGSQLTEFDKIQDTCKKLLQTKHYQALGEGGVHAIMARAKSLGIHPFEALNGLFYVVNGRVGMSTETMAALVRQRGHSVQKDPKSNNELCILHGKRSDNGDTWTCQFSREDAVAADLWGTATWKKYPAVMLYNRCMSMLFRQLFPDLSLGAGYVEDELREITKTGDYAEPTEVSECEVMDKVTKVEMVVPAIVTKKQVEELTQILEECPKEYAASMMKGIYNKGWKSIGDMDIKAYNDLKAHAQVKRKENFESQINDVKPTFEDAELEEI